MKAFLIAILLTLSVSIFASTAHLETNKSSGNATKVIIGGDVAIKLYETLLKQGALELQADTSTSIEAETFTCYKLFSTKLKSQLISTVCSTDVKPKEMNTSYHKPNKDCVDASSNAINNLSGRMKSIDNIMAPPPLIIRKKTAPK